VTLHHIVPFSLEQSPFATIGEEVVEHLGLGRQIGKRPGDIRDGTGPAVAGIADAGLGPVSLGLTDQVPPVIRIPYHQIAPWSRDAGIDATVSFDPEVFGL
jgi:hypothetical protein